MARRVGSPGSATRDELLNAALRLIVQEGYAGVTYRKLAAEAGVTASLVQYYFPQIDDVFVASIRREGERNLQRLSAALESRPDDALRVVWEYCQEEAATTAMLEFMALATHRPAVHAAIQASTAPVHELQLRAIERQVAEPSVAGMTPAVIHFLLTGIPKMVQLEEGIGVTARHAEILALVEQMLAAASGPAPKRTPARTRRR